MVASFAEAWIEKTNIIKICKFPEVASFAEAWIEKLYKSSNNCFWSESPPSRRRGLKIRDSNVFSQSFKVASFAEAWIENIFIIL